MQIWLNCIESLPKNIPNGIDYLLTSKSLDLNNPYFRLDVESKLYENKKLVGKLVTISSEKEQMNAISLIGSVDWILIKCKDWKMIPCENLIAAAESSGTKLAAIVENELEIPAIAFALEIGVDALVVTQELVELALITKSQCLEKRVPVEKSIPKNPTKLNLEVVKITNITTQGVGERICIDTTSFFEEGEGMLCGSVAKSLALIHAETIDSEFVPTRPFRVNAGGIHSYTLMGDYSTCYLSELKSGDEVLVVNQNGACRVVSIGRIKLERRPLIRIEWKNSDNIIGNVILQQAETVRLFDQNMNPTSITDIKKNMRILVYNSNHSRHVGIPVNTFSQEY